MHLKNSTCFLRSNFGSPNSALVGIVKAACSWSKQSSCRCGQGKSFNTVPKDPKTEEIVSISAACVHTCSSSCSDVFALTNSADKDLMLCLMSYFYVVREVLNFPSSNFQMTVNKFLWIGIFLWFPLKLILAQWTFEEKDMFFFLCVCVWKTPLVDFFTACLVARLASLLLGCSEYYATVFLCLQLVSSIRNPSSFRQTKTTQNETDATIFRNLSLVSFWSQTR